MKQRMLSHPNYPALVSLTDTLDELQIPYSAVIADKSLADELRFPLLAHTQDNTEDFVLVMSASEFRRSDNTLFNTWSGIAVMVDANAAVCNEEHEEWIHKDRTQKQLAFFLGIGIVTALLAPFYAMGSLPLFGLQLLNICGVVVCGVIVLHSIGKDMQIVEKLCSTEGNQGCDKVLQSKAATLRKGFGLGDLGFIYFSCISLFIFLSTITNQYQFLILLWPMGIALFGSFFSLLYQKRILKLWCKLCLVVVGIIWAQFAVLLTTFSTTPIPVNTILFSFGILFTSALIAFIAWLLAKQIIRISDKLDSRNILLTKWKRHPDIFLSLLFKQRTVDTKPFLGELFLGNPNADIKILVACSPYCNPCAIAHKELHTLLSLYKDEVGLTIRFVLNSTDPDDKHAIAATHIIDAYRSLEEDKEKCFEDWFADMDLEKFKFKYDDDDNEVDYEAYKPWLEDHRQWTSKARIIHTPTIFINGYELPRQYQVPDLKLLIRQISEDTTLDSTVANVEL